VLDQVSYGVTNRDREFRMHDQTREEGELRTNAAESRDPAAWRGFLRDQALRSALRKRAARVPTYSVPEAAALLSISQEYLYRLIQTGGFPAVRMRLRGNQGRYVIPADAIEKLLDEASATGGCLEIGEWAQKWQAKLTGGVA
jgi:excisionase family DNA binding protein